MRFNASRVKSRLALHGMTSSLDQELDPVSSAIHGLHGMTSS